MGEIGQIETEGRRMLQSQGGIRRDGEKRLARDRR
jgi:hypothetical protein